MLIALTLMKALNKERIMLSAWRLTVFKQASTQSALNTKQEPRKAIISIRNEIFNRLLCTAGISHSLAPSGYATGSTGGAAP